MAICSRCDGRGVFIGRNGRALGDCFRCGGDGQESEFRPGPVGRGVGLLDVGVGRKAQTELRGIHARGGMAQIEAMPALPRLSLAPAPTLTREDRAAKLAAQRAANAVAWVRKPSASIEAPASLTQTLRDMRERGASSEDLYEAIFGEELPELELDDSRDAAGHPIDAQYAAVEHEDCGEVASLRELRNGYFTVVLGGEFGRVTVRIQEDDWTVDKGRKLGKPGQQCVAYLNGPDNWRNYKGFAFLNGTAVTPYRSAPERALMALHFLQAAGIGQVRGAAEAYAVESSRCSRCHRMLTVPASINAGLGPDCATKGDY